MHIYKQDKLYSCPEVISVCGHMIHGVYVQSKVLRGQVTQIVLRTCFFSLAPHGNHVGLGPGYMRSLSDLPLLKTLYEARVGLDAGPVPLYKGERVLV